MPSRLRMTAAPPRALRRWLGITAARRLGRSVPLVGAAVSVAVLAQTMRRKGWLRGLLDTGLNALPLVGAVKSGLEAWRGDLFPDR